MEWISVKEDMPKEEDSVLQDVMEPQDGQRECFGKYPKKYWLLLKWKTGAGKQ